MTKLKRRPAVVRLLLAIAILAALLLGLMVWVSLPYIKEDLPDEDPDHLHLHTEPMSEPTEAPPAFVAPPTETAPTQLETLPEPQTESTEPDPEDLIPRPETNPYGRGDFQFDGRYLKSTSCDSLAGVDVSAYQGDVNWNQVAVSGIEFAMIRVGYRGYGSGKLVEDAYARENLRDALYAGLEVGVYFFSQALNEEEVEEEIAFILDIIRDYNITMPVVFDWEYISAEARTADMDARTLTDLNLYFCQRMEEEGYTPMIYFNSYQAKNLLFLYELEDYPFWLAYYSYHMRYPYRVDMWQYTCTGRVPGIQGNVDINVLLLDNKLKPE